VSNVGSENLHRKIGDNKKLQESISFILENNYCGKCCAVHL
jgi:hypothetical protein